MHVISAETSSFGFSFAGCPLALDGYKFKSTASATLLISRMHLEVHEE